MIVVAGTLYLLSKNGTVRGSGTQDNISKPIEDLPLYFQQHGAKNWDEFHYNEITTRLYAVVSSVFTVPHRVLKTREADLELYTSNTFPANEDLKQYLCFHRHFAFVVQYMVDVYMLTGNKLNIVDVDVVKIASSISTIIDASPLKKSIVVWIPQYMPLQFNDKYVQTTSITKATRKDLAYDRASLDNSTYLLKVILPVGFPALYIGGHTSSGNDRYNNDILLNASKEKPLYFEFVGDMSNSNYAIHIAVPTYTLSTTSIPV